MPGRIVANLVYIALSSKYMARFAGGIKSPVRPTWFRGELKDHLLERRPPQPQRPSLYTD